MEPASVNAQFLYYILLVFKVQFENKSERVYSTLTITTFGSKINKTQVRAKKIYIVYDSSILILLLFFLI